MASAVDTWLDGQGDVTAFKRNIAHRDLIAVASMLTDRQETAGKIYEANRSPKIDNTEDVGLSNLSALSPPVENLTATILEAGDGDALNWGILALSVLIVATAVGNILVCLAVCWDRRLQNMTNYFLMSLAIADLLVALLVMPLGLVVELYGTFPLQASLCVLWATMDVLMCTASIWHMCTMSMDRFFTLKYPMKYGRNKTKMMVALKITFVWVVSIAICSPICIMGFIDYSNVYQEDMLACVPDIPYFVIYGSVFAFYVPLCIMVVTYFLTTRILRNNQKLMKNLVEEQKAQKVQQNGSALNNAYLQNASKMTTMPLPVRKQMNSSRETSISERASVHESEDYLENPSRSMSPQKRTWTKNSSLEQTTSPTSHSPDDKVIPQVKEPHDELDQDKAKYNFEPLSPMSGNFGFNDTQKLGTRTNMPALSVSQPHLPSIDKEVNHDSYNQIVPSKSHNSLSIRQNHHKSQLSVNDLESVKNFDSIVSLNSMLSNHWGSEAWSDFDDPAVIERLSQIENEMDDCLTSAEGSTHRYDRNQVNTGGHIPSTSDANSFMDSPSFVIDSVRDSPSLGTGDSPHYNSVFTPKSSTKGVFLYPGSNPDSPGYDMVDHHPRRNNSTDSKKEHLGSCTSVTLSTTSKSRCTNGHDSISSPISTTGQFTGNNSVDDSFKGVVMQRPNSPAIMIEDTSYLDNDPDSQNGNVDDFMSCALAGRVSESNSADLPKLYKTKSHTMENEFQSHTKHNDGEKCNKYVDEQFNCIKQQQNGITSNQRNQSQGQEIFDKSDSTQSCQKNNISSSDEQKSLNSTEESIRFYLPESRNDHSCSASAKDNLNSSIGKKSLDTENNYRSYLPESRSGLSSPNQNSGPCSPNRQLLQLDLDTLIITPVPNPTITVAPVITTSPASSRSQNSPVNALVSPTSSKSGYSTIQLQPKGCYVYKLGTSPPAESPSGAPGEKGGKESCQKASTQNNVTNSGLKSPFHLHANGFIRSETSSLSPNGSCREMTCPSPSLVDTELVSQEVERSTDDTLSDPQSYSTSSTSRHHIPSLSVHWSGKGFGHGIHLKTFLRQVSFRRSKYKGEEGGNEHIMSKRIASNEKKASKVLGIIFAVFVILWSPFFIVNIVIALCVPCRDAITPPIVASLVWLGYLSSLANPIIYTMFNTSFRRAFVNILTCKLKRNHGRRRGQGNRHMARRNNGNIMYYSTYTSERKSNNIRRT